MRLTTLKRAAALALTFMVISTAFVLADTIRADGDQVEPGNQGFVDLGQRAPGEVVTTSVDFMLTCGGLNHVDPGIVVSIELMATTVPLDGVATATSTTLGPIPTSWILDNEGCPFPGPTLQANAMSDVRLTMPTTPGVDYTFTLLYQRLGSPDLAGLTVISFQVDVVLNTPPILSLPGPMTAEATGPTGAVVSFTATAADAEDDPDPTPVCSPASGAMFPLGSTTVDCSVIDSGGLSDHSTFTVAVVDTSAPSLNLPADKTAEATSAAGASVSFVTSASDTVDGSVGVTCNPASGDTFALGTTTVTCSASDGAGNPVSGSFQVTVGDSTAPTMSGTPGNMSVATPNATGTAVSYTLPTASDAVDPNPTVVCVPASGSNFAVGTTPVACTATDASGNGSSSGFTVTVTYVPDVPAARYTVAWGEPVGGSPAGLSTKSRTIPIKVRIFADGVEQTTGSASLRVVACGGGTAMVVPLSWGSGRWGGHLDASRLNPGCYVAVATWNGNDAGSFALDIRGGVGAASKTPPASTPAPTAAIVPTPSPDVVSDPKPGKDKDKDKDKDKASKK
jgi:hypothetical protein